MKKILLINSPVRQSQKPTNIPYGLSILAAVIDNEGHDVTLLDANAYRLSVDEIVEDLKGEEFDLVGVSGLITTYGFQKKVIPKIREILPDSIIMSGGGCASSIPGEMLKWIPELDVCCIGEGEKTIVDIINHLDDKEFEKVAGIAYREDGQIIQNEKRPYLTEEELNSLPYPALDLLPMEEIYFKNSAFPLSIELLNSKRRIDLVTERGCPFSCTFCYHIVGDNHVRFQSARYVIEMIKYFRFRYAIDFVMLLDENMLSNRKRAFEFCDLFESEGLVDIIKWGTTAHANAVNPEILKRLKECGCTYLEIGGESADNRILKDIKKNTTVEKLQYALDETLKAGINPVMNFMMGYENEDMNSIYASAKFWKKNGFEIYPFIITPYPGCELYYKSMEKILDQYGGNLEEYILDLGDATKFTVNLTNFSDPELLGLRELMAKKDLKRLSKYAMEKYGIKLN